MTNMSFYSVFQTSARFSYTRKVTISFLAGPFVDYVFDLVVMEFYL